MKWYQTLLLCHGPPSFHDRLQMAMGDAEAEIREARRKGLLRPGYLSLSHLVIQKPLIHFPAAALL